MPQPASATNTAASSGSSGSSGARGPTKIILVKHARPQMDPTRPPHEWGLSDEGRASCKGLATRLQVYGAGAVISSVEAKASETGGIVAETLAVPFATADGLHEHDRSNVPVLPTPQFVSTMAQVFKRPGELVLGKETGDKACDRFEKALAGAAAKHSDMPALIVITHGTVIALLLARKYGQDGYAIWRRMGLPSFVVLPEPGGRLEIIEKV
jgi:broad specificity phosphatase PhoE